MSEWQTIDTAPRDGREVLLHNVHGKTGDVSGSFVGFWDPEQKLWATCQSASLYLKESPLAAFVSKSWVQATHWCELPKDPV